MQTLKSWHDGESKRAIEDFVARVTTPSSREYVPPEGRVAVFDNDGTLWTEKPLPVEMAFILERLADMADGDVSLRDRQPWKAAYTGDYSWLSNVITKHYQGDDSDVNILIGGILEAFDGMPVEAYVSAAEAFLQRAQHPTLARRFRECAYKPMVELLRYLESHRFVNYIASGGDRDFMRAIADRIYTIPGERVVGSSNALRFIEDDHSGAVAYAAKPDVFDDGPVKPVRIWSRIGRRPIVAVGNSNGDIQMLQFAGGPARPALRLLLLHDDNVREFEYTSGAEKSLELAHGKGWTVVSMKNDWKDVFPNIDVLATLPPAA